MRAARLLTLPLALGLWGCPPAPSAEAPASAPASQPSPSAGTSTQASAKGVTPETRGQVDPDGVIRRGQEVAQGDAMTVEALLASARDLDGKTVTVTGEVTQVCKKKGCWMAIRGDEGGPTVRVTSKGYAYFVPEDSAGMAATVTGELSVKTLDAETAQHYEDDAAEAGEAAPEAKAGALEVAIASTGLELRR